MVANVLGTNSQDTQQLQQEQFIRQNVASWFNLPPHKLGDSSRTSYNSLEQENRAYLTGTLQHWLKRWELECDTKLLTQRQRQSWSHYFSFNRKSLLQGDTESRYRAYEIGRRNEWLSANDVRQAEDMPLIEDPMADQYINPNRSPSNQPGMADQETTVETDSVTEIGQTEEVQALLANQLDYFERVLKNRIRKCCKAPNFITALDDAAESMRKIMSRELIPVVKLAGIDENIVWERLETARQLAVDAAGSATLETLPDHVASATASVSLVDIGSAQDMVTI
jgi:hypothetical protein